MIVAAAARGLLAGFVGVTVMTLAEKDEQVIDLVHKGVYAFVTGMLADRLIAGPAGSPRPRRPWALR